MLGEGNVAATWERVSRLEEGVEHLATKADIAELRGDKTLTMSVKGNLGAVDAVS